MVTYTTQRINIKVDEDSQTDRTKVLVEEFVIQKTDGRGETTIWAGALGWITVKELYALSKRVEK